MNTIYKLNYVILHRLLFKISHGKWELCKFKHIKQQKSCTMTSLSQCAFLDTACLAMWLLLVPMLRCEYVLCTPNAFIYIQRALQFTSHSHQWWHTTMQSAAPSIRSNLRFSVVLKDIFRCAQIKPPNLWLADHLLSTSGATRSPRTQRMHRSSFLEHVTACQTFSPAGDKLSQSSLES